MVDDPLLAKKVFTQDNMQALIGDYAGFFSIRRQRLHKLGIDISNFSLSHFAFRTQTHDEYLAKREAIEEHCCANVENVWNARPISKLLLAEPLQVAEGLTCELIELIPPPHREQFRIGLEHVGIVVGEAVDEFAGAHRDVLNGEQHQSDVCEPYFIQFGDNTAVKFYRCSLLDVCVKEGLRFDGFYHA